MNGAMVNESDPQAEKKTSPNPTDQFKLEKQRGHFARAAFLGAALGLPEEEVRELKQKALWQMSAVYRNAGGTKRLAQEYGFSKKDVQELLERLAERERGNGNQRILEACYEPQTGRYLAFEEWLDRLMKIWDKLPT